MSGRRAFSLLELMVCMAILLLLVALFLPVAARARNAARRAQCQVRLRQLGAAFLGYAGDHDGLLPHEDDGDALPPFGCGWYRVLVPYLGAPVCIQCPALSVDPSWHSYKMNSLLEDGAIPFRNLGSVAYPSLTMLAFDGRVDNPGLRMLPKGDWDAAAPRHGEGTVCLYCDAHVAWVPARFDTAGWTDVNGQLWSP